MKSTIDFLKTKTNRIIIDTCPDRGGGTTTLEQLGKRIEICNLDLAGFIDALKHHERILPVKAA